MGKRSILLWENGKSQRTILNGTGCAIPDTSTNQFQEGRTKLCRTFAGFLKELDQIHAFPAAATPQQREEWTHRPHDSVVIDTEDIE